MIRGSLQRIAVLVSGRQLAQLGARQKFTAAFPLETNSQHQNSEAQSFQLSTNLTGYRCFSSNGPSSQEGTEDTLAAEDAKSSEDTNEEASTSAVEGAEEVAGAESASEGTSEVCLRAADLSDGTGFSVKVAYNSAACRRLQVLLMYTGLQRTYPFLMPQSLGTSLSTSETKMLSAPSKSIMQGSTALAGSYTMWTTRTQSCGGCWTSQAAASQTMRRMRS
jgi:hypothetical protein